MAASLDDLTAKIDAGERLSDQDIAALGSSRDIITLGMLATTVRRRLRGNEVTYVRVADLKVGTTTERTPGAGAVAALVWTGVVLGFSPAVAGAFSVGLSFS